MYLSSPARALVRLSLPSSSTALARVPVLGSSSFTRRRPTCRPLSSTSTRMFALTPYRSEQPRTFALSKSLPRLPVPPLAATLDKYLISLRPFLLDQAARQSEDAQWVERELAKRRELADSFQNGLGKVLQERLKDVDRMTPNNWLDDHFWLNIAYHSWRVPLPVNSNWWLLMKEDHSIPAEFRASIPDKGQFTDWQIRRAAKLTQRLVDFKLRLDRQEILPDSSRAGPFEMHQYSRVFGVTRLPLHPSDTLAHAPHPHPAKHIVVMAHDHFYSLDVVSADGNAVSPAELERGLWAIADDATRRGPAETSIGVLSGDDRDSWTTSREHLLALSPTNRASVTRIEDSLFVLSLDPYTLKSPTFTTSYSDPSKDSTDLDAHIRNASTAGGSGKNRWWDKAVGIHVESNGRASMVGEHSPCDALIPSIVCDYALAEDLDPSSASQRGQSASTVDGPFEWVIDDRIKQAADKATKTVEEIAQDSEGRMLWFDEYGAGWIKNVGKHSPDAYLQMALQLAFHKTHNRPTATYETASTRLFARGRTEVIRTFSEDSWKWVKAMREGQTDHKTLYSLLSAATKTHNTLTRESSTGRGIDRHLMGLRLLLRPDLEESHPLFEDELFGKSQEWVLSTSGLSAGDRFYGTGFGSVYPNGYGINYLAGDKLVKFGIESKVSNPETSTETFRKNLVEALREMREVCEKGIPPPADGEKPKL
ncbi:choline/carnitine O-acyltransferase [Sporobolomyces koalae]|uniref:choline/carnitine O-acyltransferase n=1 Tax=Sporobolomyces koalae TaxID=500713 RepID=UPI0031703509